MAGPVSAEVQAERDRCERVALAVATAAGKILGAAVWSDADRVAWEARIRAASDIATVIRSGTEPF